MTNADAKILSIVVPSYNVEAYLDRSIGSIVDSSRACQIEVLIVNDGSTDSTGIVADSWAARYPQIVRVIHKENGHYGTAVTRGIQEATGSYFKILDADDYYSSSGLDELIDFLASESTPDVIFTDYDIVDGDANVIRHCSPGVSPNRKIDLLETDIRPSNMHAVTFRTQLLQEMKIELDGGVPYTDVEFILYPMTRVRYAYYLPVSVYQYFLGREEQSCSFIQKQKNIKAHSFVLDQILSWYAQIVWSTTMNRAYIEKRIGSMAVENADICLLQTDTKYGLSMLLQLEDKIKKFSEVMRYFTDRKLCIIRKSNYLVYGLMSKAYRVRHNVK